MGVVTSSRAWELLQLQQGTAEQASSLSANALPDNIFILIVHMLLKINVSFAPHCHTLIIILS